MCSEGRSQFWPGERHAWPCQICGCVATTRVSEDNDMGSTTRLLAFGQVHSRFGDQKKEEDADSTQSHVVRRGELTLVI